MFFSASPTLVMLYLPNTYKSILLVLCVSQGLAKVQQVFTMTGHKSAIVAGLLVQQGRLRNKATHQPTNSDKANEAGAVTGGGYTFRVIRQGKILLEESKAQCDLKRSKTAVHEVSFIVYSI